MQIQNLTGLAISNEQNLRETIQRLSYFSAQGTQDYRDDLFDHIVINALAKFDPGGKTPGQIRDKIIELTGLQLDFEYIRAALCRLERCNDNVYCTENDSNSPKARFGLQADAIKVTNDQYKKQVEFENSVLEEWKQEVKVNHPDVTETDIGDLIQDLNTFSYRVYAQHSASSAALVIRDRQEIIALISQFDDTNLGELLPDRAPQLEAIRSIEIPKFFRDSSVMRKKYIAQQMRQFFTLHMMQLDPTGAALLAKHIEGGFIYLDTNILFNLFGLNGDELQKATNRLVDLSRGLKYRPIVTSRTIQEYEVKIKSEIRKSSSYPIFHDSNTAKTALRVVNSRGSERAYWEQASKSGVYTDPNTVLEPYKYIEDFLKQYDIEIEDSEIHKVMQDEKQVQSEVSLLHSTLPDYHARHDDIPEHDAIHRLFILRMRTGYETDKPLNEKYWFLTTDSKLPVYDRRARGRQKLQVPFCVMTSQWMQLLYPYRATVDGFDETLATTLDSPLFRAFPSPSPELIHAIVAEMNRFDSIPPRIVTKMIADQAFIYRFQEISNEPERIDLIESYFLTEMVAIEDKIEVFEAREVEKQSKIDGLSRQSQEDQTEIERLAEIVHSLEKDRKELSGKISDYELSNNRTRDQMIEAQDGQKTLQLEKEQLRERIGKLEILNNDNSRQKRIRDEEMQSQEERFFNQLDTQSKEQSAWRERATKSGLSIIVVMATIALFIADNPLNKTGDKRWFAATYIVTGMVFIQIIIFYVSQTEKRRKTVFYAIVITINVLALMVVYSKPFGINIPDMIAWVALGLTILGTVFAAWSFSTNQVD